MPVGCDGKEVSEGRWEKRGKLVFGEEFEERGFVVVKGGIESR